MKGNTIEVKDMLNKDDIHAFWKSIWNVKIDYNTNTTWIKELTSTKKIIRSIPKHYKKRIQKSRIINRLRQI